MNYISSALHYRLPLGIALALFISSAQAENTPLRVPLTPLEAHNLGLDPGHDGALFRVLQNSDSLSSKGGTQSFSVSAREQRGVSSLVFLQDTADGRWCEVGSGDAFADIALNLPSAALITSIRIWGLDQNVSNNLTTSLIERCTPNNQAGSVITSVIAELSSSASSGNFTAVTAIGANNTVDNDACSYTLRTRYSTPGETNFCAGSSLRLQKIRLSYNAF
jgi:hypothetical protein